jgi:hypothetical protein
VLLKSAILDALFERLTGARILAEASPTRG